MELKLTIKDYMKIYLNPFFWVMTYNYDKNVDKLVETLLENQEVLADYYYKIRESKQQPYFIPLNDHCIWIQNYPYSYGVLYSCVVAGKIDNKNIYFLKDKLVNSGRPSRKNIYLLNKFIKSFDEHYPEYFI